MDIISLGLQPVFIVLPILLLFVLGFFALVLFWRSKAPEHTSIYSDEWDKDNYSYLAILPGIAGFFMLIATFAMFMPFDAKYYNYYEVSGTVTSVSNVFEEYKGEFTAEPVILLDNGTTPLVVSDSRIVTFQDREIDLLCTVSWNYLAEDEWRCQIREGGY